MDINDFEVDISKGRTEEFFSTVKAVSEYLKGLSISTEDNDKLVELMVKHSNTAERSGFELGVKVATGILKDKAC